MLTIKAIIVKNIPHVNVYQTIVNNNVAKLVGCGISNGTKGKKMYNNAPYNKKEIKNAK
jgi:hypothetical protein